MNGEKLKRARASFLEGAKWCVVALLPQRVALWLIDAVPLGSWAPYVFGQAMGTKGVKVESETED